VAAISEKNEENEEIIKRKEKKSMKIEEGWQRRK